MIIVQSGDQLDLFESQTFKKLETIQNKKCTFFIMNESNEKQKQNQTLVFNQQKKEGTIFIYKNNKFEDHQHIMFPETPQCIQWMQNTIIFYLFQRKEYQIINLDQNNQFKTLSYPISNSPLIKAIPEHNIFLLMVNGKENIGMFVDLDGNTSLRSCINFQFKDKNKDATVNYPIINISIINSYMLSFTDQSNYILVHNINDQKFYHEIQFDKVKENKFKSISSNYFSDNQQVYFCSSQDVFYFKKIDYKILRNNYIKSANYEKAIQVFNQEYKKTDENYQNFLEQLKINLSLPLFLQLEFEKAIQQIKGTNFDIRQFLLFYPDNYQHPNILKYKSQIKKNDKKQQNNNENKKIIDIIQEYCENNKNIKKNEFKQKSDYFLIDLLEFSRDFILKNNKDKEIDQKETSFKKIKYKFDATKFENIKYQQILEIIDYSLIKLYCQYPNEKDQKFKYLLENKIYLKDKTQISQFEQEITSQFKNKSVLAKYLQNLQQYEESLKQWKVIGEDIKLKENQIDEAVDESIMILKKIFEEIINKKYENLNEKSNICQKYLQDYFVWIIEKRKDKSMMIFKFKDSEKVLIPKEVLDFFQLHTKYSDELKEKYLEYLVFERFIDDEEYHTELCLKYLQKIQKFNEFQGNDQIQQQQIDQKQLLNQFIKQLDKILRFEIINENNEKKKSLYKISRVLEEIGKINQQNQDKKKIDLMDQEIFLYEKGKLHEKAIKMMVIDYQKYDKAEEYCANQDENLLDGLFKIYLDLYTRAKEKNNEKQTEFFQKKLNEFLKKYGTHEQLNPLFVLQKIPDDWEIDKDSKFDGLYAFLKNINSYLLNKKRNTKVAKNLSEMYLLNSQVQLVEAKQKHFVIDKNTKCASLKCNNKIISGIAFYVYPNGKIVHQSCINNLETQKKKCPVTDQEFTLFD